MPRTTSSLARLREVLTLIQECDAFTTAVSFLREDNGDRLAICTVEDGDRPSFGIRCPFDLTKPARIIPVLTEVDA
jgi:hypothetical protein